MLIDMAIQDIMDIANTYVARLEDVADRQAGQPMRDLKVERSAYSQVPAAQRLGAQHEAAQEVFLATVEGVIQDLADFKQRLVDSAASMERQDQTAQEAFTALGRRYRDHTFASDAANRDRRSRHAEALDVEADRPADGQEPAVATEPVSTDTEDTSGDTTF